MKIALVNINKKEFRCKVAPLGLCSISGYLKKFTDHEIVLIDQNVDDIYVKAIIAHPDVVCVSSTTANFDEAKRFINFCKINMSNVKIILGGVHISLMPDDLPKDVIGVMGEGEKTVMELLKSNPIYEVAGICYIMHKCIQQTSPRHPIKDIDHIPIPDRSIVNQEYYFGQSQIIPFHSGISGHMLTSRGCPYNCAFCSTKAFWGKPRMFSVDRIIDEMNELIDDYHVEIIHIFDDLFLLNKNRFFEIVDRIESEGINQKVKFMCLIRSDQLNDEIMLALKRMNVVCVGIGMESGNDRILQYLKQSTVSVKDNQYAIDLCKKYEIACMGSFMICNLSETISEMKQTVDFIKSQRNNPFFVPLPFVATPLPGTMLWNDSSHIINRNKIQMDIPKTTADTLNGTYLCDVDKTELIKIFEQLNIETILQNHKNKSIFNIEVIKSAINNPQKAVKVLSRRLIS